MDDHGPAALDVVEEPRLRVLEAVARVVGPDPGDDGVERGEVGRFEHLVGQHRHLDPEVAKGVGDVVPRAHDVADLLRPGFGRRA